MHLLWLWVHSGQGHKSAEEGRCAPRGSSVVQGEWWREVSVVCSALAVLRTAADEVNNTQSGTGGRLQA
jgi:hypothetical protein